MCGVDLDFDECDLWRLASEIRVFDSKLGVGPFVLWIFVIFHNLRGENRSIILQFWCIIRTWRLIFRVSRGYFLDGDGDL